MTDSRPSQAPPALIVSSLDAARLEALLESPRWRDLPAAQALQEDGDHAFGAAVDIVGLSATVAGDRCHHSNTATALGGKAIGDAGD